MISIWSLFLLIFYYFPKFLYQSFYSFQLYLSNQVYGFYFCNNNNNDYSSGNSSNFNNNSKNNNNNNNDDDDGDGITY